MSNQPGPVPDHRLNEMMEQMRLMREENLQMRNALNNLYSRQAPAPTNPEQPLFEEKTAQALEKFIQKKLDPIVSQTKNQTGMLIDRNDLLEFQQRYGVKKYDEYAQKIEGLRQQAIQQGRYMTREEAYKLVYFEESNKKAQQTPEAPQAPQGPTYDPYLGQWINPPAAPQAAAPVVPPAQVQPGQQQPPAQAQQQVTPPVQTQDFQLPPDFMSPGAKVAPTGAVPRMELGQVDEQGLAAFETKFGDVPL